MLKRRTTWLLLVLLIAGASTVLRYAQGKQDEGADDALPVGDGQYIVYAHRSKSQVNVHADGCRFLGQHGGLEPGHPENSRYSDPIDTFEVAWACALAWEKQVTHACTVCLPSPAYHDYRHVPRRSSP